MQLYQVLKASRESFFYEVLGQEGSLIKPSDKIKFHRLLGLTRVWPCPRSEKSLNLWCHSINQISFQNVKFAPEQIFQVLGFGSRIRLHLRLELFKLQNRSRLYFRIWTNIWKTFVWKTSQDTYLASSTRQAHAWWIKKECRSVVIMLKTKRNFGREWWSVRNSYSLHVLWILPFFILLTCFTTQQRTKLVRFATQDEFLMNNLLAFLEFPAILKDNAGLSTDRWKSAYTTTEYLVATSSADYLKVQCLIKLAEIFRFESYTK